MKLLLTGCFNYSDVQINALKSLGYTMASYISTRAYIGYEVEIGDNCFIMENNVIQSFAKIGNNVVL